MHNGDILPAFPLSLVAFPGENLNLRIFEPRYKQLIHECDAFGTTFAVVPFFEGKKIVHATKMELVEIAHTYPDGNMDVRTRGIGLLKIIDLLDRHPGKLYPGIEYETLPWDDAYDFALNVELLSFLEKMYEDMEVTNIYLQPANEFRTYQIAHKVGFTVDQEIEFLRMNKEFDRQQFMLDHLKELMPMWKRMKEMRDRAALNGHFKNVIPRK